MLQGDCQQVFPVKPPPRRPRWVQEPPDPWKGAFRSPWHKGALAAFLTPSLSAEAACEFTSQIWELLVSRRLQTRLLSSLRVRRCPVSASMFSGLEPGASEVLVAHWGPGQLVGSRPEHVPSPLGVCMSFSANGGFLHAIGAELRVWGWPPGIFSARKGLRPAPGL